MSTEHNFQMTILNSHGIEFINEDDKATKLREIIYYSKKRDFSKQMSLIFHKMFKQFACMHQTNSSNVKNAHQA
jgi:hypothetical protein